jgi:hypothetical protein
MKKTNGSKICYPATHLLRAILSELEATFPGLRLAGYRSVLHEMDS